MLDQKKKLVFEVFMCFHSIKRNSLKPKKNKNLPIKRDLLKEKTKIMIIKNEFDGCRHFCDSPNLENGTMRSVYF